MRRVGYPFLVRRDDDWELPAAGQGGTFGSSPWQSMRRMQEDLDRLFSQVLVGPAGSLAAPSGSNPAPSSGGTDALTRWAPHTDISETDREWAIEAELPGVNKDDIDVEIRDHHLILSAEMRGGNDADKGQAQGRQFHRRERRYGFFQRVIPLPESVTEEQISCEFRNGLLTVHIPKAPPTRQDGRRIPIRDVDHLASETAGGRTRSPAEIHMTEDEDETADDRKMAGAKGGEVSGRDGSGAAEKGGHAETAAPSVSTSAGEAKPDAPGGAASAKPGARSKSAKGG